MESDYNMAIESDYWAMAVTHLKTAAPFMLKTLRKNSDEDFAGVEKLKYAPKNTDMVESNFSIVDRTCDMRSAHVQSWLGLSHARSIGLMSGKGDMRNAAKRETKSEQRRGISNIEEEDERISVFMDSKRLTNFFSLDRELRWRLIRDVQRNYKVFIKSKL